MSGKTSISWTDATWNPTVGCTKVSQGCKHCYAERLHNRRHQIKLAGPSKLPAQYDRPFHEIQCMDDRLGYPARWRKPRRIFVDSVSDLFHEGVPFPFIKRVFDVMLIHCQHTYQVLTKRPARLLEFLAAYPGYADLLPDHRNVWLGVSVEDQRAADERIPLLLKTPASVRFLSCEPLLEAVDLGPYLKCAWEPGPMLPPRRGTIGGKAMPAARLRPRIDWVIVGGESGPKARPMELDWARSIRDQCIAAGVPFFFKQTGGPRPGTGAELDGDVWHQWPETGG